MGAVFLAVAPDCRAPGVVRIVGVMGVVAGIGILVMGWARLDASIGGWLRPTPIRLWATIAIAIGGLLVSAGPKGEAVRIRLSDNACESLPVMRDDP